MTLSDGPWRRVPPVVVDLVLVAIAVADSALSIYDDLSALKASAIVLAAAGLMVRRRWPWLTFASVLPALVVSGALLAGVITVYSLAVVERRLWRLAVATVIVGVGSATLWVGLDNAPDTALSVLYAVLSATAPVGLGLLQRTYTDLRAAVDELNRSHEAERAHLETQILTQERTRIAREMHDVVSHHVSLVAVQAGVLQVRHPDSDVGETARVIRGLAGQTLDELRQMVAVLRSPADEGSPARPLAPQQGTDGLAELIAVTGIPVTENLGDLPDGLSPAQQRTIYRTVQEALTNVRKHAGSSPTAITVATGPEMLTVSIANARPRGTGSRRTDPGGRGHGLVGLRERAELVGGRLCVDETDAGFTVVLQMPRDAPR